MWRKIITSKLKQLTILNLKGYILNTTGYYRSPCLTKDVLFFISEDDIWRVSIEGGTAYRFTNTPGIIYQLYASPDGKWLAYSAGDYGSGEIYCLSTSGGTAQRLTFHPSHCDVVGWDKKGENILFSSNMDGEHSKDHGIYSVPKNGGHWHRLNLGLAHGIAYDQHSENMLIHRGYNDPAVWKKYKGGRAGKIWLKNKDGFVCLTKDQEFQSSPMIYNGRIYFVSDTNSSGNIFSFDFTGKDLQQHTFHDDFYVRKPSCYPGKICYQLGGDLWTLDIELKKNKKLEIDLQSCGTCLREKFVNPEKYLTNVQLSPSNEELLITTRGQLFRMKNWQGNVNRINEKSVGRQRNSCWFFDGIHIATIDDSSGEDEVVIYKNNAEIKRFSNIGKGGYIEKVLPSPEGTHLAISVQAELYIVDWKTEESILVDKAESRYLRDFSWSPDSKWIVYGKWEETNASLFLYNIKNKKITRITTQEAHDYGPCFSPNGKYIYFLSKRTLNPYGGSLQAEYNFPETAKPYIVMLSRDEYSPFASEQTSEKNEHNDIDEKKVADSLNNDDKKLIKIDTEGITERVQEIPIKEGIYFKISAYEDQIFLLKKPLEGRLSAPSIWRDQDKPSQKLIAYNIKEKTEEVLVNKLTSYSHTFPFEKMVLKVGKALCVVKAGTTYKKINDKTNKKTGWIDLKRIKLSILPQTEWKQMFREAWRLQRDFFWQEHIENWQDSFHKYSALLPRIRTRNELTDLITEMHGDLKTSHAYAMLGDQPLIQHQRIGLLGARLKLEDETFRIDKFYYGDKVHQDKCCPLLSPGLHIEKGDSILAINGENVGTNKHLQNALINLAKEEVELTIAKKEEESRTITIKTLSSDLPLRYRDWVNKNRNHVIKKAKEKIGYIHVPDMSTGGLVAFHQDFLWQYDKEALIVDVRFNGGGNISPTILSKLQRKVIAHFEPRRGRKFMYPRQSIKGTVVVLCNEYTGSDGDIFCEAFRTLKIGTLIGTRTWGGVVGIIADKKLVDGGIVTQPEFAFEREGKKEIEGVGVEPDIVIENDPQAYINGKDPQLDKAIEIILKEMKIS